MYMTDLGDRKIVANSIASFDIIRRFALHHDLTYRRLMTSDLGPPAIFLDEATSESWCVGALTCISFVVASRKDPFFKLLLF